MASICPKCGGTTFKALVRIFATVPLEVSISNESPAVVGVSVGDLEELDFDDEDALEDMEDVACLGCGAKLWAYVNNLGTWELELRGNG